MGLTAKQEQFCRNIVSGMTGKDAYINAYNTKGKDTTINQEVVKLLARDDINERITTLQKPIVNHIQATTLTEREKVKNILWDRLQLAIERDDDQSIIRYTDQINRMNAEYINVNRNIDDTTPDIQNVDTTTLLRLVE